jgi:transposase-like protein
MNLNLHKNARTTPAIRQELRESTQSERELAREYQLNRATVRKWRRRDTGQDASHRPHRLHTTLTPAQELVVIELRKTLLLPLDDLLAVTREFINPERLTLGFGSLPAAAWRLGSPGPDPAAGRRGATAENL